jgi:catechol 2,3-dioxygenase-like lactoylglutathione lyase family enzyme
MVESLGFLGVRTDAFDATVALYRDVLHLEAIHVGPGATWFRTTTGAQIHVYGPGDDDHGFFPAGPVVGLVVDDFDATRSAMAAAGISFIGQPQRHGGSAWNHYRGPDGNIYEIMGSDRQAG